MRDNLSINSLAVGRCYNYFVTIKRNHPQRFAMWQDLGDGDYLKGYQIYTNTREKYFEFMCDVYYMFDDFKELKDKKPRHAHKYFKLVKHAAKIADQQRTFFFKGANVYFHISRPRHLSYERAERIFNDKIMRRAVDFWWKSYEKE